MADEIEEIKRKIDIVEFINAYVPLKKAGRNYKALCPFHSEKTPSFMVSPERQIWKCFGCGEGGDIFAFLMKMEGLEFGEALRTLAKRAGVKLRRYRPSESEKQKQRLYEINHLAAEFYHYLLTHHPAGKQALDYILGRGISKQSIKQFKLGFAPNMWAGLQQFLVGKKGYQVQDLEGAGLIIRRQRASSGSRQFYDRFRARLMFPLKNHRGDICGFSGRVFDLGQKGQSANQPEAKYINTSETLIYHKSDLLFGLTEAKRAVKKADRVVVVEGELDAISSYQAGVLNTVAIKGSALTERQVQLLARFTKNLTLALDADPAGDRAARRGVEIADAAGMAIRVVEIKGGKDPDEVAQKDPNLWRKLVGQAVPVYDYFLDSAFLRHKAQTAEGKRKIGQELVPVLAKITDKIVQSHYLQILAERLGTSLEAVTGEVIKLATNKEVAASLRPREVKPTAEKPSRREILEEHSLGLGFQSDQWEVLRKRKVLNLVKTSRFVRILETLKNYRKRFKTQSSERLAKMLDPELVATFNKLYLLDLADLVGDESKLQQEFEKTLYQLEKFDFREQLRILSEEIRILEKQKSKLTKKDEKKLDQFGKKFRDLSAQLAEVEQKE